MKTVHRMEGTILKITYLMSHQDPKHKINPATSVTSKKMGREPEWAPPLDRLPDDPGNACHKDLQVTLGRTQGKQDAHRLLGRNRD